MTASASELRHQRLRRMRALATGLLLLMAAVFGATFALGDGTAVGYIRAFAEAAMVGALADWFAVTALFRHPLGVPIPHTAIIPRRKDQFGEALAGFIRDNFLSREALAPRLAHVDFAAAGASWLAREENASRVGAEAALLLDRILAAVDDAELHALLSRNLQLGLRRLQLAPLLGDALEMVLRSDREREITDAGLRLAYQYLHDNRALIHQRIIEESPWWLPNIIDREIYRRLVAELEGFLLRVMRDPDDPDRQRFNRGLRDMIRRLRQDPQLTASAERIKRRLLDDPAMEEMIASLLSQLRSYVKREARQPDSRLARRISGALVSLAQSISAHEPTHNDMNQWLREVMTHTVSTFRDDISQLVTSTVRSWDPALTAHRLELYLGRDLQYIRINGTLVGGCVGLLIHALLHAAGQL